MTEISVIVPVYKVEPYLRRCVDSILAQTFTDFELILVDDGSPDNCGAICDEYVQKDARVHVIHQENGGLSAARNAGIDWVFAHSDSEWISFVDSDDWVHPQMLEWMLYAVKEGGTRICACSFENTIVDTGFAMYAGFEHRKATPEEFYIENAEKATVAWGKLYSIEKWNTVRFPLNKLHEDVYTTHRVLFSEDSIAIIDAPLYQYYSNPDGITHTVSNKRLMDELEGQRLRAGYFIEHGFQKAYNYEVYSSRYLANEWNAMNLGINPEDRALRRRLSRRFRKAIRREHISFKKHIWAYECAYPNLMKVYWLIVALGRKLGLKG